MIKNYAQLASVLSKFKPVRAAIAAAADESVISGIKLAEEKGIIVNPVLTGSAAQIREMLKKAGLHIDRYEIIDCCDDALAAATAVQKVKAGEAALMIKGSLKTEIFLKAILDRDNGIRSAKTLSNMSLFEMASYHKFIGVSDNAIIPLPDLEQKKAIIENTKPLWTALGIKTPKVAVLAAVETIDSKMPATIDAACLSKMAARGQIKGFDVDGPLAYDAALSRECAETKHIPLSAVIGDPDLLVAPNLEAANILGKSFKLHGGAVWGGLVFGAKVPVVLNSRSDDAVNRFNAILLARAAAENRSLL